MQPNRRLSGEKRAVCHGAIRLLRPDASHDSSENVTGPCRRQARITKSAETRRPPSAANPSARPLKHDDRSSERLELDER